MSFIYDSYLISTNEMLPYVSRFHCREFLRLKFYCGKIVTYSSVTCFVSLFTEFEYLCCGGINNRFVAFLVELLPFMSLTFACVIFVFYRNFDRI